MLVTVWTDYADRTIDSVTHVRHIDGALVLSRADGSAIGFAPGRWIGYEAHGATPGTLTAARGGVIGGRP